MSKATMDAAGEASAVQAEELAFMPATELAAAIRARRISPGEVVDAIYARVREVNPGINAFCALTLEEARLEAAFEEARPWARSRPCPWIQ